ncbi:mutS protein homolog 4-like [Diprion similis]|uniref:mutS protein homolog 4-like n=1 Tax=Diprion similis TaxID=362088 RepID=UPI001EF9B70A|nr:mutS protein homolog 4-like [Diprion similis]
MNVVDKRKSLISSRGKGGRQNTRVDRGLEIFPKYQFRGVSQQLVPRSNRFSTVSTEMAALKTPGKNNLKPRTSSSSVTRSGQRKSSTPYNTGVTGSSSTPTTGAGSPFVIAITEGRGDARGEVGIAVVNVQHPHLILSQISDRHAYMKTLTKILLFKPIEIIMPDTMIRKSGTGGNLYECIRNKFPGLNIAAVSRQHFSNTDGLDRIRTLCAPEYSSVEIYVKQKFYALAAAGALLKYIEYTQNILYVEKSMYVEFQSSQDTTVIDIDIDSAQNLELVTHDKNFNKFTLLGMMDRCLTPGGKRYLRASILQPSCNRRIIEERQACVSEMVEDNPLMISVQSHIRRLCNVDQLLVVGLNTPQKDNVASAEKNLNYVLSLKTTLEVIPLLQIALRNTKANFFRKVSESLKDKRYESMMDIILEVLQPDAQYVAGFNTSTMQRCFALKSGLNDMLDIARQAYCELIDDMKGMVETLALKYNLPLTLGCSASLGYHIQMDSPKYRPIKITNLPRIFIEVQKHKNSYLMTTEALLVLSQRCKDACEELHLMSNVMLKGLLSAIREHISCLYQLSNDIAELDLIVSLARISSLSNYTRPSFGSRTELKNSLHPLMDLTGTGVPVPNDVNVSPTHNFNVITGPNMGGKSVYLRQIVMLQIMAQIGCYVPAEMAEFRITDRIFCRLCFEDSIECNASSFVLEIKETQYILQTVTCNSLVIIDELCRGTTVEEGETIAFAICEQLLNTSAFVFFTTHFLSLTLLAELYPNVTNYHFGTMCRPVEGSTGQRLIYTHKLNPGIIFAKNYGLSLAETSGIRISIVKHARMLVQKSREGTKPVIQSQQIVNVEGKKYYDEVSKIHRLIQDDEFNVKTLLECVRRLENSNISVSEQENPSCSDQNTSSTRSSMLSITERYNRLRQKRPVDTPASDRNLMAQTSFLEPKAGPSNVVMNSNSLGPSPSKKSQVIERPHSANCLEEGKILTNGGKQESRRLTTYSWQQELRASRQITSVSNPQNIEPPVSPATTIKLDEEPYEFSSQNSNKSESPSIIDLVSQLSTDTIMAKISARRKEAEIFRQIEGDDFQEFQFYDSILSRTASSVTIRNIKHQ